MGRLTTNSSHCRIAATTPGVEAVSAAAGRIEAPLVAEPSRVIGRNASFDSASAGNHVSMPGAVSATGVPQGKGRRGKKPTTTTNNSVASSSPRPGAVAFANGPRLEKGSRKTITGTPQQERQRRVSAVSRTNSLSEPSAFGRGSSQRHDNKSPVVAGAVASTIGPKAGKVRPRRQQSGTYKNGAEPDIIPQNTGTSSGRVSSKKLLQRGVASLVPTTHEEKRVRGGLPVSNNHSFPTNATRGRSSEFEKEEDNDNFVDEEDPPEKSMENALIDNNMDVSRESNEALQHKPPKYESDGTEPPELGAPLLEATLVTDDMLQNENSNQSAAKGPSGVGKWIPESEHQSKFCLLLIAMLLCFVLAVVLIGALCGSGLCNISGNASDSSSRSSSSEEVETPTPTKVTTSSPTVTPSKAPTPVPSMVPSTTVPVPSMVPSIPSIPSTATRPNSNIFAQPSISTLSPTNGTDMEDDDIWQNEIDKLEPTQSEMMTSEPTTNNSTDSNVPTTSPPTRIQNETMVPTTTQSETMGDEPTTMGENATVVPTSSPTESQSSTSSKTLEPTKATTDSPTVTPTSSHFFTTNEGLREAVEEWVTTGSSQYGPISGWDVSRVEDFGYTFYRYDTFNDPGIGNWNMSSATRLRSMFELATEFNQPLNKWDVSSVTDFNGVFWQAKAFNQPLSNWSTGLGYNLARMFKNAWSFNQDIGGWNVSSCEWFEYMFNDARAFNQDLSSWDVSGGIHGFPWMFGGDDGDQEEPNKVAFNNNLCAWGPKFLSNSNTVTDMFAGTSCPSTSDPELVDGTWTPLCHPCND